jgi:predicted nucleic acid-binding protein
VKEPVVADSTCLIGLERVGMLHILPQLFDKISIPPAVHSEFGKEFNWLEQEHLAVTPLVTALRMVVGKGEAEAIALAVQNDRLLITDDKQARAAAKRFGLSVIGTVGILLRAKAGELIDELKPILDDLQDNGFYMSHALREEALRIAGE